jgi:flotillin
VDTSFLLTTGIVAAVAVIVLFVVVRSMWRVAEPNQALVISGLRYGTSDEMGFKVVCGSGTLVMPGLQRVRTLDLSLHEAPLAVDCVTQQGIKVQIQGVVIYKVGDDRSSISNAARRFLDAKPEDMSRNIQNLFDGHLRSIIGGITMEDLIRDREKLTGETRDAAGIDMQKLGLIIDSLQIKDIVDPSHYIDSLAAPHVAEVQKNARIAQANADQAATQVEQEAAANKAEYMRDTATKKAGYQAEIDKANAIAAQAGPLADATAKQDVVRAATATAALEASQKEQELQVSVRKPADAQAYSTRTIAEGNRDAAIAAATANAQQIRLNAEAQADAARVTGAADGEAAKARGEGEGAAIQAKLLAEAAGIDAKGKALAGNKDAIIAQSIAENVPQIVREASGAFDKVGNIAILNGAEGVNNIYSGLIGLGLSVLPQITKLLAKKSEN